jgi:hypothetical protein
MAEVKLPSTWTAPVAGSTISIFPSAVPITTSGFPSPLRSTVSSAVTCRLASELSIVRVWPSITHSPPPLLATTIWSRPSPSTSATRSSESDGQAVPVSGGLRHSSAPVAASKTYTKFPGAPVCSWPTLATTSRCPSPSTSATCSERTLRPWSTALHHWVSWVRPSMQ